MELASAGRISVEGAAERVVVGRLGQADVVAPLGRVGEQRLDAAEALALVLAQDEAGEELGGGEVASAEPASVGRQAPLAEQVGEAGAPGAATCS